jgi:hypothetical protein
MKILTNPVAYMNPQAPLYLDIQRLQPQIPAVGHAGVAEGQPRQRVGARGVERPERVPEGTREGPDAARSSADDDPA